MKPLSVTGFTYTTVSTVSAPSLLGGLVDLDVLDDQVAGIESLGVGIGLSVLEEADEDLSRLDGPASPGDTESLACGSQQLSADSVFQFAKSSTFRRNFQSALFQCIPPRVRPWGRDSCCQGNSP